MVIFIHFQIESSDPVAIVGTDIAPAFGSIVFFNNENSEIIEIQVFPDEVKNNSFKGTCLRSKRDPKALKHEI
jgi:hypothetical protein